MPLLIYTSHAAALSRTPADWQRLGPGVGACVLMLDQFHSSEPSFLAEIPARIRAAVGDRPLWLGFSVDDKPRGRTLCDPDDSAAVELLLARCQAFGTAAAAANVERVLVETESFMKPSWPASPGWERLGQQVAKALGPLPVSAEDGFYRARDTCPEFLRGLYADRSDRLFVSQSTYGGSVRPGPHAREVLETLGARVACGIGYSDCELEEPSELILHLRRALRGGRTAWLYRAGCDGHAATSDPFRERADAPERIAAVYAEALRPVKVQGKRPGKKRKRRG